MLVIEQCYRTAKGTVHTSCLACVSGQNASCARVIVSHFAELTVGFFYGNV